VTGERSRSLVREADLSDVRRSIGADLEHAGADASARFDCLVAVTEACTNALTHGHGDASPRVSWEVGDCTARFWVQDYAGGGWRDAMPGGHDDLGERGLQARVGGFGLELMRGLMDDVAIRPGGAGTTVELVKRFC
jgi:serine/threonine-protein kinase RsbW